MAVALSGARDCFRARRWSSNLTSRLVSSCPAESPRARPSATACRRRHAVALGRARGDSAGQDDTSRLVKFELHRRARKQSLAPLSATAMATPLQWLAFNVFVLI